MENTILRHYCGHSFAYDAIILNKLPEKGIQWLEVKYQQCPNCAAKATYKQIKKQLEVFNAQVSGVIWDIENIWNR